MPASPLALLLAGSASALGLAVPAGLAQAAPLANAPAGSVRNVLPAGAPPAPEPIPPAPSLAAPSATPTRAPLETLAASIQRRLAFPFQPNCQGNTQEIVACLWQRRDRQDQRLATLLGSEEALEAWRGSRAAACRRSAERGSGGSIQPILGLGCENALNATLIQQTAGPLLR